ncbi:hypothetical protein DFH11DRAFT_1885223 [Phellopilus nigrolimitatus]|nr:hypothetical protein DFH11DRAFT_1885223 [Phellopilus nigrolimitatus]
MNITVDYDGPRTLDTSSLVSLDEYKNRNSSGSSLSLSFGSAAHTEPEDYSVTDSLRDTRLLVQKTKTVRQEWVDTRSMRMADDEVLKKYNFRAPGLSASTAKEFPVIFKLASQLRPPVETISLAHNDIQQGVHLASVPHYLSHLRNLSLEGNKIKFWKDVD